MFDCSVLVGMLRALGCAVGFDLIGLARDELRRLREVRDRFRELADRDVAVAPMPVHPRIVGMLLDPFAEVLDRITIAPEVGHAPPEPDRGVGIVRVLPVHDLRLLADSLRASSASRRRSAREPAVFPAATSLLVSPAELTPATETAAEQHVAQASSTCGLSSPLPFTDYRSDRSSPLRRIAAPAALCSTFRLSVNSAMT